MSVTHPFRTILPFVLVGSALLGLAACSDTSSSAAPAPPAGAVTTTTSRVPRPVDAVDVRLPVGGSGARLHLSCSGSGASTILLLSGFEDAGDSWGPVTSGVTDEARVCSYSRFGLGTSDDPPATQTFATQAEELHDLLGAAGEPGPYVVVGHSFGGAEAVTFADRFADEVGGLMLVDASPTTWPDAACAVEDDGSEVAASFQETCDRLTHAEHNAEQLDAVKAFHEVSEVGTLAELPMVVLTRAELSYAGLAPESAQQLVGTWNDGQQHWASLSSASELVPVADTSHYIQLDQPSVVIEELRTLL